MLRGYVISINETRFAHAHKELSDHEFVPHIAPLVSVKDLNVNVIWNTYKRANDPNVTTPERTIAVALTHAKIHFHVFSFNHTGCRIHRSIR